MCVYTSHNAVVATDDDNDDDDDGDGDGYFLGNQVHNT